MESAGATRHLLTVVETAERLRVSERTVRRLISSGVLPAVQLRRRVAIRVDADELERLLFGPGLRGAA